MKSEYKSMKNSESRVKCQNGDRNALGALLERYLPRMEEQALKRLDDQEEAQVAVQNTCKNVLNYKKKITSPWFLFNKILENECTNIIRERIKKRKRGETSLDDLPSDPVDNLGQIGISTVDDVDEIPKWNTICDAVVQSAGFLQPSRVKSIFLVAMKGGDLLARDISRFDDRIGLDAQKCLDFLRTEAKNSLNSTSGETTRLQQYRAEAQSIVEDCMDHSNHDPVQVVIDVHMVTMPWPGWPFTPWKKIICHSKVPQRLSQLVSDLKKHGILKDPKTFKATLILLHCKMLKLHRQWQWPFVTPY